MTDFRFVVTDGLPTVIIADGRLIFEVCRTATVSVAAIRADQAASRLESLFQSVLHRAFNGEL